MEKRQVGSYSWFILVWVVLVLLVGWLLVAHVQNAQSASQVQPAIEPSQIQQIEAQQKPDNLLPVKKWLEKNNPQARRGAAPAYSGYTTITDDLETTTLKVPKEWKDIDLGHWVHEGKSIGHFITAATDLARFEALEAESGVFMGVYAPHSHQEQDGASVPLTLEEQLELLGLLQLEQTEIADECDPEGRYGYVDMFYQGEYDFYVDCSQGTHQVLVISSKPTHESYIILLRITITTAADIEAISQIFDSFQVIGKPGNDHHHDH